MFYLHSILYTEYYKILHSILYTEEPYKKDLHDPDNHNDVITYLEPDILECKVKWALRSITINKASGGDEFQLSYFNS